MRLPEVLKCVDKGGRHGEGVAPGTAAHDIEPRHEPCRNPIWRRVPRQSCPQGSEDDRLADEIRLDVRHASAAVGQRRAELFRQVASTARPGALERIEFLTHNAEDLSSGHAALQCGATGEMAEEVALILARVPSKALDARQLPLGHGKREVGPSALEAGRQVLRVVGHQRGHREVQRIGPSRRGKLVVQLWLLSHGG